MKPEHLEQLRRFAELQKLEPIGEWAYDFICAARELPIAELLAELERLSVGNKS